MLGCGVGSGVVVGILPILAHILCGYKATTLFQAVVPVVVIKLLSCDSNIVFFIRVVSNVRVGAAVVWIATLSSMGSCGSFRK